MKNLNLSKLKGQIDDQSEKYFLDIENKSGFRIPLEYKEFLNMNNGGYGLFEFQNKSGEEFSIKIFFPIAGESSFKDMYFAIQEEFPSGYWLPFGFDEGDWIYCINLSGKKYGQIYLMRTDEENEEDAFEFVCDTFSEFIDELVEIEDE